MSDLKQIRKVKNMDDFRFPPSLPASYDMEPRSSHAEIEAALSHVHASLRPDYVGIPIPSPGSYSSRTSPGYPFGMASEYARADTDEVVRRTNLAVQLVNGQIAHSARYAQVQPKICRDGRFPNEFRAPKTVEELRSMDPSSLDRVLGAYQLPTDMRSLRLTSRDTASSKVANLAKLCTLFDFLGASRIADHERLKRNAIMPF